MKISKFLKMLPFALVACMLLSTVSAFAATSSYDSTTKKVTVVVSDVTAGEEVAIMVYDSTYTSPSAVPADKIWYIDQAAAGTDGTVTFEFYLKDGAGDAAKQVAIGKATGTAADLTSTFEVASTPSYTPGDVDGSGVVDGDDTLLLAKKVAGWDVTLVVQQAGDVDGSGVIDGDDTLLLAKFVAGWDVTLKNGNIAE